MTNPKASRRGLIVPPGHETLPAARYGRGYDLQTLLKQQKVKHSKSKL